MSARNRCWRPWRGTPCGRPTVVTAHTGQTWAPGEFGVTPVRRRQAVGRSDRAGAGRVVLVSCVVHQGQRFQAQGRAPEPLRPSLWGDRVSRVGARAAAEVPTRTVDHRPGTERTARP